MTTGYLTQAQLADFAIFQGELLNASEEIAEIIKDDEASDFKISAAVGEEYYNCEHDIIKRTITVAIEGETVTLANAANNQIVHPLHKIFVDQKAAYIAGKPLTVSVMMPEVEDPKNLTPKEEAETNEALNFNASISAILDEDFDDILNEWIVSASNSGCGFLHVYIGKAEEDSTYSVGPFRFVVIPTGQCIPRYNPKYQRELDGFVRHYEYDIVQDGVTYTRKKFEWWTKTDVTYWIQGLDNIYRLDPDYETNPAPHWSETTSTPGAANTVKGMSWGKVPFIPLPNNKAWTSDLVPVKTLIDAIDLVKSDWCNDLEEFQELVYVIKNFSGNETYSEILKNLKSYKLIKVSDNGGVETIRAEVPVEARLQFINLTKKEAYAFGQAVDIDSDKLGNNPSGVSLQFVYSHLDMKANVLIRKLMKALKDFSCFLTFYVNMAEKKQYDYRRIVFTVNKSQIFNEVEKMQALNTDTLLSEHTKLSNHPLVNDVDDEERRKDSEAEASALKGVVSLDNADDTDPNADESI